MLQVGKDKRRSSRRGILRGALLSALCASLLLAGATFARAAGDLPSEHDYVGVAKCRSCHKKELMGNQVAAWEKGPHYRAYETLKSQRSIEIALERGIEEAPHESEACLNCHVTAFGVPVVRISKPLERVVGVQCESCHGPGRDYRKKKIMSDSDRAHAKGLWDAAGNGAICQSCHNPESPTYDPARYVLADGSTVGFDFSVAKTRIPHPIPEEVKGNYLAIEKKLKEEEKARLGE